MARANDSNCAGRSHGWSKFLHKLPCVATMKSVTSARIKLISGMERPNLGTISLRRQTYENRFKNIIIALNPEDTVPFGQVKDSGICNTSDKRPSYPRPNLNSALQLSLRHVIQCFLNSAVIPVRNRRFFLF